jgi:hypothetical protein
MSGRNLSTYVRLLKPECFLFVPYVGYYAGVSSCDILPVLVQLVSATVISYGLIHSINLLRRRYNF